MFLLRKIWEPTINSPESEYFPSLTIDSREIVFTRQAEWIKRRFFHKQKR